MEEFQREGARNQWLNDFVQEVVEETKQLDEEIEGIKYEISKYKGLVASTDNNREKLMKKLQEELTEAQKEGDDYNTKLGEATKTIDALRIGINNIYKSMGWGNEAILLLSGTHGVTESNMMQYLGVIEQRTNELLEIYKFSKTLQPIDQTSQKQQASKVNHEKPGKAKYFQTIKSLLTEINSAPDESEKDRRGDEVYLESVEAFKEKGNKRAKELLNAKFNQ